MYKEGFDFESCLYVVILDRKVIAETRGMLQVPK